MEDKDKPPVPSWPPDSKDNTGHETEAPPGIEPNPTEPVADSNKGHKHGIMMQNKDSKMVYFFEDCKYPNCTPFGEPSANVSALGSRKRDQSGHLKKQLVQGLKKTMTSVPKSFLNVKKSAKKTAEKETTVYQPEVQPYPTVREESSHRPLLLPRPPAFSQLPYSTAPLGQNVLVSFALDPNQPSAVPCTCSNVILQPCATPAPRIVQPQVSTASSQELMPSSSDYHDIMEAAEALMTLKNSSPEWLQAYRASVSAGDSGEQPPNPTSMPPGKRN